MQSYTYLYLLLNLNFWWNFSIFEYRLPIFKASKTSWDSCLPSGKTLYFILEDHFILLLGLLMLISNSTRLKILYLLYLLLKKYHKLFPYNYMGIHLDLLLSLKVMIMNIDLRMPNDLIFMPYTPIKWLY